MTEPVTQQQEAVTKQKNPLRIEQGKKLVEYNKRKKEELKCLNEQITKRGNMVDHKPKPDTSTYVYAGGLRVLGLAIGGYLLYNKFKKQKQNLIDVPPPPVPKTMDYNSINTLLNRYKSVLSSQMTKSLGKSIINLYSNLACSLLH